MPLLRGSALATLLFLTSCSGILYLPTEPFPLVIAPILHPSSDSLISPDIGRAIAGHEKELSQLRIGVLGNPSRKQWKSKNNVDPRTDENTLLTEYLAKTKVFMSVVLVEDESKAQVDYLISCSLDCCYSISLESASYAFNFVTFGVGFLLGLPYQESAASYLADAVFFEKDSQGLVLCGGTIVHNEKNWFCDNCYWRPDFYSASSLSPLFSQILYDFVLRSGCLAKGRRSNE